MDEIEFHRQETSKARAYAREMLAIQAVQTLLLYLFTPSSVTARLWEVSGNTGTIVGWVFGVCVVAMVVDIVLHDMLRIPMSWTLRRWRWLLLCGIAVSYWLTATVSLLHPQAGGVGVLMVGYAVSSIFALRLAWHLKTTDYRRLSHRLEVSHDSI